MRVARLPIHLSLLAPIALIPLACTAVAQAQDAAPAEAAVSVPARGALMNKVEAQYGAPAERHAAVGKPPITRWDYPNFSVFFEYQHVIHSVVR